MFGIDPIIVLFGLGVGILIGLTGIGGGSLMTPLLIIVLGVQPVVAIGTDLAYSAITKTVGGWRHFHKGTVDMGVARRLGGGGVPGAVLGVLLLDYLQAEYGKGLDKNLLGFVAAALLLVSIVVLVRAVLLPRLTLGERFTFTFTARTHAASIALGFVLGVILGVTSVGGGALAGAALLIVFRLTPQRIVGTDVLVAALMTWAAGLTQVFSGHVDFALMGTILIGPIPGVWIGTRLMDFVPAHALRVTLGAVLLGSALAVVEKAGVYVPIGVIFGAPVAVGVLAWGAYRAGLRPPDAAPAHPPSAIVGGVAFAGDEA